MEFRGVFVSWLRPEPDENAGGILAVDELVGLIPWAKIDAQLLRSGTSG
jgi:hypothetical protein